MLDEEIFTFDHVLKILKNRTLFKVSALILIVVFIASFLLLNYLKVSYYSSQTKVATPWFDTRDLHVLKAFARSKPKSEDNSIIRLKGRVAVLPYPTVHSLSKTGMIVLNSKYLALHSPDENSLSKEVTKKEDLFLEKSFYELSMLSIRSYLKNENSLEDKPSKEKLENTLFYKKLDELNKIDSNHKNIIDLINLTLSKGLNTKESLNVLMKQSDTQAKKTLSNLILYIGDWKSSVLKIETNQSYLGSSLRLLIALLLAAGSFIFLYVAYFIKILIFSES